MSILVYERKQAFGVYEVYGVFEVYGELRQLAEDHVGRSIHSCRTHICPCKYIASVVADASN